MKKKLVLITVLLLLALLPAMAMASQNVVKSVHLKNMKITTEGEGSDEVTRYVLTQPEDLGNGLILVSSTIQQTDGSICIINGVQNNNAGPVIFADSVSFPITPISGANTVTSTFSASLTDSNRNGMTLTAKPPIGIPEDIASDSITEMMVTTVDDGSVRKNIGLDLAGPSTSISPDSPIHSGVWGSFDEGPVTGPVSATGWNSMQIDVNFEITGGGDMATYQGCSYIDKTPNIPEFPTVALPAAFIVGLIGAVLFIKKTKEN
jgi:hypothetical protein